MAAEAYQDAAVGLDRLSENSSSSRSRRLMSGVWTSLASRGLAALGPLLTIPVALSHLGVSAYGAWSAALAFTAFATFADLGLGVGLMTRLADAVADGNNTRASRLITSGYLSLLAFIMILLGALWSSSLIVDWSLVIGGNAGDREAALISLVTLSLFCVNIVGFLIVRIQYAAQEVARSNIWQAAGSAAAIAATYIAAACDLPSYLFVLVVSGTPLLIACINAFLFFFRGSGRIYRPSWTAFSFSAVRELLALGGRFLLIGALMAASLSTDSWIVAQTTSLDQVPEYAVPARIFGMLGMVVAVLTVPLWPTNVEALRRGDTPWVVRTTLRMTVITSTAVAALAVAAVAIGPWAIEWWLGGAIEPSTILLVGLGVWAVVQAVVAPAFMVQNAAEMLRPQTVAYAVLLLILPLKWWVSTNWGYEWLPAVTAFSYCLVVWPAAYLGYRVSIRNSKRKSI